MRILVFSDIHGNLPALEKLIRTEPADLYISLGDVVNYGPWQNECVDLLESLSNSILIKGNHEEYYLRGEYLGNSLANRFFNYCFPKFKRLNKIKKYVSGVHINGYNFAHTFNDGVIYPDTHVVFDANYIIGHSHHQSLHECGKYKLYAIGSVGQNRQYINRCDYLVMNRTIELRHLVYDESMIIKEMCSRRYPEEFIYYYSKKARA